MKSLLSQALHSHRNCELSGGFDSDALNANVNHVISHMLTKYHNKSSVDVDSFIDEINSVAPGVWEHGCKLTQSVNDRKACILSPIFS